MFEDGESILVKGGDGGRTTKLAPAGKLMKFLYEDTKTQIEVIQRGCRISGNGRCLGWRSSNAGYSWITYQEFITRAKNFGSGLLKIGVALGQSNQIGIYSQNRLEWVIAQYGSLYYSSPIVALYDALGPDACTYMINHGEITAIICDTERKVQNLLDRKEETPSLEQIICVGSVSDSIKTLGMQLGVKLHLFKDIEDMGKMNPVPCELPKPTDVSIICYTSGTTGHPKGVVLTHETVVSALHSLVLHLGPAAPDKTDTLISYLPLAHVFEQLIELLLFVNGGSIGFFEGNILLLFDDMKVLHPTVFPAVPRLLNKLFDKVEPLISREPLKLEEDEDLENEKCQKELIIPSKDSNLFRPFHDSLGGNIKLIICSAAPISDFILKVFKRVLRCNVTEFYGQTEASGPIAGNHLTETSFGHVGTPVACCMIKLQDVPELGYYAKDNVGEVCVKGYNVFKSYFKEPEKTAETINKEGWLQTGDIGMWLPNGTLKLIDRKKHIFKLSQGEYIAPEKIENFYLRSPYISQMMVHGDSFKNYLVAIVVPDEATVMAWCKENVKCSSFLEACATVDVKELILEDMKRIAEKEKLLSFEQVKKIHLHPKLFTFEEGLLTPTYKTKRAICSKHFEKELQNLYLEDRK